MHIVLLFLFLLLLSPRFALSKEEQTTFINEEGKMNLQVNLKIVFIFKDSTPLPPGLRKENI